MSNFADVLGNLEGGHTFASLNDDLAELVSAVQMHRKPGEISVTLKVTPNGERAVSVTAATKVKMPEPSKGVTTFFTTQAGDLLRRDPNQPELPLRDVSEQPRDLKTA
jgi:hypothetical protein